MIPARTARLTAVWRRLRGTRRTPVRTGAAVGAGFFIGALPVYGLHLPLLVAACLPLGLDVVLAYLVATFNNPLTAPFLLTLEVELGSLVLTGRHAAFDVERARDVGLSGFVIQGAVGAALLGAALAAVGGTAAAVGVRLLGGRGDALDDAEARTLGRYRSAAPADRAYVAAKLASDPLARDLVRLGPLGDVLDLGCGRGQLILALLDAGAAGSARGIDADARKVGVARTAAAGAADFREGDVRCSDLGEVDTVLLVDVLHYLDPAEQDALLRAAAGALRRSGRMVVRDIDGARRLGAALAIAAERVAVATGYNRGASVTVRPIHDLARVLSDVGLEVSRLDEGTAVLGNAVLVARRPAV